MTNMNETRISVLMLLLLLACLPRSAAGEEAATAEKKTPDSVSAARKLFYAGEYEKALAAAAALPEEPAGIALRAEILIQTGRDREANTLLTAALKQRADHPLLLALRGETWRIVGAYAQAEADWTRATKDLHLEPQPGQMRALYDLARLYKTLGRRDMMYEAAYWFFDFYAQVENEDLTASQCRYIGAAAALADDCENGIKVAALGQKKDKNYLPALLDVAGMFLVKYQYADAQSEYGDALKMNPHHPEALTGMAAVAAHHRNLDEVMEKCNKALETNPRYVSALMMLAELEVVDEKLDKAHEYVGKVLTINPDEPQALLFKASLACLQEDKAAHETLSRHLARVYKRGELDEGQTLAAVSSIGLARLQLAVCDMLAGNYRIDDALSWARKAAKTDPENATAVAGYGIALMRQGQDEKALPILRQALQMDPYNVRVYNLVQLVKRNERYAVIETEHSRIRLFERDAPVLRPYMTQWAEEHLSRAESYYGYEVPGTVQLNMLKSHEDFAARVTGLPRLDANGATFGRFVALVSPAAAILRKSADNWSSVMLHELAHVVTLQGSRFRIPRWLTEGMSVHIEGWINPSWDPFFKTMMAHGEYPDLNDFNRHFNRPKHMYEVPAAYAAAGLFVRWFAEEFGEEKPPELVRLYGEGKTTEQVFQAAVGKSVAEMNRWLRQRLEPYAARVQTPIMEDPSAAAELEKTAAKDPQQRDAALKLLRIYRMTGNPHKARELAQKYVEGDGAPHPVRLEAAAMLGELAYMQGKAGDAKKHLETVLARDPSHARAHNLLGHILLKEGNATAAEAHFKAAIEHYPRYVGKEEVKPPYVMLVKLYQEQERADDELALLETYSDIRRDDPSAFRRLATLYRDRGENGRAVGAYMNLFAIDPYTAADHDACAELLETLGRADEAKREREIAAACRERDPDQVAQKPADAAGTDAKDDNAAKDDGPTEEKQPAAEAAEEPEDELDPNLRKLLEHL